MKKYFYLGDVLVNGDTDIVFKCKNITYMIFFDYLFNDNTFHNLYLFGSS